jgi:O-antigen/teichoic acid export membrane protein
MASATAKVAEASRVVRGDGRAVDVNAGSVARGVSWIAAGHAVGQLAWFGSLFGIAAMLPPRSLGSVTVAMVVVQVAWLVVGSGTRGSFIASGVSLTRGQVTRAIGLNVSTGVALGLTAAFFAPALVEALSPGANVTVVRVLALSISLYGVSIVPLALMQKAMHFKAHAGANAGAALAASAIAVPAAFLGAGVWSLVLRQVLFQVLLACFAWLGARRLLPPRTPGERALRAARPRGAPWFFALTVLAFVGMNVDFVVVGRYTDVAQLGIYSLAFTVAFAPTTQFAWQVGKVLFPAAAGTETLALLGARAGKAVRVTSLLLLPAVPPTIALAPELLPRLLGPEWRPMVLPFQLLLVAGVTQALFAIMREFLLGSGSVAFCVRLEVAALLAMTALLLVLVPSHGIEGAAIAHLVLVAPLAVAYGVVGARRVGSTWYELCRPLLPLLGALAVESLAVGVTGAAARLAGASAGLAWPLGGAVGLVVVGCILWQPPFRESRALLTQLRPRAGTA